MAVSPNAVTFTSSYSALSYLVAFAVANVAALPVTFPSLPVLMNLSASSGATRSGLFVFCDLSHCCSSAATAFSVPPVVWPCDHAALPNESNPIRHNIHVLFIDVSLFVATFKTFVRGPMACGCQHIEYPMREDVKLDFKADFRAIKALTEEVKSAVRACRQMSGNATYRESTCRCQAR